MGLSVSRLNMKHSYICSAHWLITQRVFYVGLNDLEVEGDFRWTDGTPKGGAIWWKKHEPNNFRNSEHCAYLSSSGLSDAGCSGGFYFICEVQGSFFTYIKVTKYSILMLLNISLAFWNYLLIFVNVHFFNLNEQYKKGSYCPKGYVQLNLCYNIIIRPIFLFIEIYTAYLLYYFRGDSNIVTGRHPIMLGWERHPQTHKGKRS